MQSPALFQNIFKFCTFLVAKFSNILLFFALFKHFFALFCFFFLKKLQAFPH